MRDEKREPRVGGRKSPLHKISSVNILCSPWRSRCSAVGKLLFDDPGLVMHTVTEESERQLTTRWTLQFRFKLLPWRPLAQFTGVSQYTLDEQARVVRQAQLVENALRLRPATHRPPS